jgi:hypothetical protein
MLRRLQWASAALLVISGLSCAPHLSRSHNQALRAIYVWSPLMPLSEAGIPEIRSAAAELNVGVTVIRAEDVEAQLDARNSAAASIAAAGGLAHYPSLLFSRDGDITGSAILGFKTAAAYRSILATARGRHGPTAGQPRAAQTADSSTAGRMVEEIQVSGVPSAYFRFIPNHGSIAFTRNDRVYILDIESGKETRAPGWIDFIPSPDGRLFVTPAAGNEGLQFYSAQQVIGIENASNERPQFTDTSMRDQYPSMGVLSLSETNTTYRVLTSWFERAVFRDYRIGGDPRTGRLMVEPLGRPVIACSNWKISIPIMAHSGRELAARDELAGTTKVFALADDGTCTEVLDLDLPTGKVAWSPDGTRLAFSMSRGAGRAGVFVLERRDRTLVRIAGSENLRSLVFPDFIGLDRLVYLAPTGSQRASTFRIACCF